MGKTAVEGDSTEEFGFAGNKKVYKCNKKVAKWRNLLFTLNFAADSSYNGDKSGAKFGSSSETMGSAFNKKKGMLEKSQIVILFY